MELFRKPTIDDKFINKRVRLFINRTMCLKRDGKKKLFVRHNKNIRELSWMSHNAFVR